MNKLTHCSVAVEVMSYRQKDNVAMETVPLNSDLFACGLPLLSVCLMSQSGDKAIAATSEDALDLPLHACKLAALYSSSVVQ